MKKLSKPDALEVSSFFRGLHFFAPVALLIRTQAGLSLSQFFTLQAILSLIIFVGEVPGGFLTDRIGYKKTLILSNALSLAAKALLLAAFLAGSWTLFVIEVIVEGCSWFLNSGTFDAYVYSQYSEDEYLPKMARLGNIGEVGFILSTLTYAGLFRWGGIPLLIVTTIAFNSVGVIILCFIPKDVSHPASSDSPVPDGTGSKPHYTLRDFFSDSRVITGILFGASTSILSVVVNFFYVDKLVSCALPEELMSAIIIGYTLVGLLDEPFLRILKKQHYYAAFLAFVVLASATVTAFALSSGKVTVIVIMVLLPCILSIPGYISNECTNQLIDSYDQQDKRATIMSVFSMGGNTVDIFVLFGSAFLVARGITFWYLLTAAFMLVAGLLFYISLRRAQTAY